MRHHYTKPDYYERRYGETYFCSHPVYSRCTLYRIGRRGLAVIQQRFDSVGKSTRWTEIDPWLVDAIYLHAGFRAYFEQRSGYEQNGLYPTVTVRQLMWALRMKPIPRERWETVFDRREI